MAPSGSPSWRLLMACTAAATAMAAPHHHAHTDWDPWTCKADLLPIFCDSNQPINARVAELVAKMTDSEKVAQIGSNTAPSIDRLGIPAYQWWGEAQHGVCESESVHFRPPTPVGTSFPEPGLTAATFDKELFSLVGEVIGSEGRAMANAGNAGLTFWAPNINLVRDPRWGRLLETPGEDPLLTSEYAMRFVKGMQGVDPSGRGYLRVAATPKHYAGYSLDNWHGMDRYHYDGNITKQDWADTYSQPFQAAIVGGNASGLMCSYNANRFSGYPSGGIPSCADPNLLTKIAREDFGFDGYITGDCGAAEDVWTTHGFGGNASGAASVSIRAGMDVDCGDFVLQHALAALETGQLTRAELDVAVAHLFRVRVRLGYFDPRQSTPWGNASYRDLNYTAHDQAALRAAREGIVLLSHQRSVLPLSAQTLAVSGPNADNAANMQGIDCHGVAPFLTTPRAALSNYSAVTYTIGCLIGNNDTAGFAAAEYAARSAEATVLVLGLDPSVEYEMLDRTDLLLPGVQEGLVHAVRDAMGPEKPLVIALMGGGVVDTSRIDSLVDAVLWVGYPGQAGGQALAEVLFGDVIPSGRSPLTWYKNEYASDSSPTAVSMLSMNMRPDLPNHQFRYDTKNSHTPNPGRTYRFVADPARFVKYPFGHGLSYGAHFRYESVTVSVPSLSAAAVVMTVSKPARDRYTAPVVLNVTVTITNVGNLGAGHAVLLYAAPPSPLERGNPIRSLVAFERIPLLAAGETAKVRLSLTAWGLALADSEGVWGTEPGSWTFSANPGDSLEGQTVAAKLIVA